MNDKEKGRSFERHYDTSTDSADFRDYVEGAVVLLSHYLFFPGEFEASDEVVMVLMLMFYWVGLLLSFFKT